MVLLVQITIYYYRVNLQVINTTIEIIIKIIKRLLFIYSASIQKEKKHYLFHLINTVSYIKDTIFDRKLYTPYLKP